MSSTPAANPPAGVNLSPDRSSRRASQPRNEYSPTFSKPTGQGHRHVVHGGNTAHAQNITAQTHDKHKDNQACTHEAEDGKPCLAPLCTKCAHSKKNLAPRLGYIITSRSFTEASTHLAQEAAQTANERPRRASVQIGGLGQVQAQRALFDRSSIVKQALLLGTASIKDYYDVNVGNLGKGSYGSVSKAKDLRTGVVRAVKIVHKPKIENITRLKREILIMKRLDHPNIIRLYEVFEDEEDLYLVMELCTGGELFDRIIKMGHFKEEDAAVLMRQVFSAVAYCHHNDVMHRDLKPENLLFADPSPTSQLKVIDWGFAAKCGKNHKFTSVVGTPYYVAPEVLFGLYDKQCDVWSLGVILYILLCGYPPFHGKDNKEILRKVKLGEYRFDSRHWEGVSKKAKDLVQKLMTYDPKQRLTAADALRHPWILQKAAQTTVDNLNVKLAGDLLDRFRNFQKQSKLKKLAITVVAYQSISEKDIGVLHDIFTALDKNGDGVLTIAEMSTGLQQMNIKLTDELLDLLEELDTDGNGSIDYTEFIAASIDHKLYEQESACRVAFRVFDIDGDGKITIDEMHSVLESSLMQDAFTKEMIEEMVKEVDVNNDGSIDFEEFMRMMRGNQKKKLEASSDERRGSTTKQVILKHLFGK